MNDDRTLLERAAKAAGMYVLPEPWPRDTAGWFYNPHNGGGLFARYSNGRWNPLTDDGDALRLAVKLRIDLDFDDLNPIVEAYRKDPEGGDCLTHTEALTPDANAATRRAIVRAAAALGA